LSKILLNYTKATPGHAFTLELAILVENLAKMAPTPESILYFFQNKQKPDTLLLPGYGYQIFKD